jgi:hypothetical protein
LIDSPGKTVIHSLLALTGGGGYDITTLAAPCGGRGRHLRCAGCFVKFPRVRKNAMAFIPYPDGARAVMVFTQGPLRWTNTLWFEDLTPASPTIQDLADYLGGWAGTQIMPNLDDSVQFQYAEVYDMSSVNGQVYLSSNAPISGGVVGDTSPLNTALVVTFYSAFRGRSGRGRNYITGFGEVDVSTNAVGNAARVTAIENAYINLKDNVQQQSGYYWVVASQFTNGVPRVEVLGSQVLTVSVRSNILGTQRRRVPRP